MQFAKQSRPLINKEFICFIGIGLFAYGVSITNLVLNAPDISNDSITYLEEIQRVKNHSPDATHIVPLFLYLVSYTADFFHLPYLQAGICLNIAFQSLTASCCYSIVRFLSGNNEAGIWTGLLLSLHPRMLAFSNDFLRESLFLFIVSLFLLSLVCAIKFSSIVSWYMAGLLNVLAFFTRYEGAELLVFAIIGLVFVSFSRTSLKKCVLYFAGFLLGTVSSIILMSIFDLPITFLTSIYTHIVSHWKA